MSAMMRGLSETDPRLDLFQEIDELKRRRRAVILAHFYQEPVGAYALSQATGEVVPTLAKETILATGGLGAMFPPPDFCLASLGLLELDLDPRDVLPPLKSDRPEAGPIIP